jgi:hypothetical protein
MNISFWDGPKKIGEWNDGKFVPGIGDYVFLSGDRAWEVARIVWVDADIVRIGLAMDEKP